MGSNCPTSNILTTEGECRQASNKLGVTYAFKHPDSHRPAGCYWQRHEHGLNRTWVTQSFFNTITAPSAVEVYAYANTGGICQRVGM